MNEIINFNPEQSANKVKTLWNQRNKIDVEIVSELYKAKEFYSNQGFRSDLQLSKSTFTKLNTFQDFLEYSGLYKQKVYQWFDRYIPEENKLLSWKEYEQQKQIEQEELKQERLKKEKIINEYITTENKPIDFKYSYQEEYETKLKEKKDREKRIELEKERLKILKEQLKEKENNNKKIYEDIEKEAEKENERINNMVNDFLNADKEKLEFREKYLSQITNINSFFDVIDDYIESLQNDNNKLEALNTIIKYCRDKANKLHRIKE